MKLRELFEAQTQTAVIAFGRMNPPTIGHQKLVDKIKSLPGDPYVFLSQSQKPKTDPLAFADKLRYAKFFFPEVTIGNPEVKTIIQALQKISSMGYENLIYVAGSDRVQAFEELINKYNGQEYNFGNIQVVSAGERDPDADGAEGMSASKMRAAAAEGDLEAFKQGVPRQEVADEMFAAVRAGMGIRDAVTEESCTHGRYWCSTDKKYKCRKGPKQTRESIKMKIAELLREALDQNLPPTIKTIPVPQFPQAPTQMGDLGDGQIAEPNKEGGVKLSGADGTFSWDKNGQPSKWAAPAMGGTSQVYDMKTGDITVTLTNGGLNVSAVYDKTGKLKQGGNSASYDMGTATVTATSQGNNTATVRGATPAQDQTIAMK